MHASFTGRATRTTPPHGLCLRRIELANQASHNTGSEALISTQQPLSEQGYVRLSVVRAGTLARRIGLLIGVTLAEVVVGLWLIPLAAGGTPCSSYGCGGHQFASWVWPTICIIGLSLIWVGAAWSLVIKPVRMERRYGRIRLTLGPGHCDYERGRGLVRRSLPHSPIRWFSMGQPSGLVRDGLIESNDTPPRSSLRGSAGPRERHDGSQCQRSRPQACG